jgi:hypothetical protein
MIAFERVTKIYAQRQVALSDVSCEHHARMGTLLRAVGLTDDAGRKVATYSTGMRTWLGIAASLMNDPELLVWDEPTAGLDPISRRQTLELLEQFRHRKTVVLSSHILGDVDRVCHPIDRQLYSPIGRLKFQRRVSLGWVAGDKQGQGHKGERHRDPGQPGQHTQLLGGIGHPAKNLVRGAHDFQVGQIGPLGAIAEPGRGPIPIPTR